MSNNQQVCRFWKLDNPGACSKGNDCNFAHIGPSGVDVRTKNPKVKEFELFFDDFKLRPMWRLSGYGPAEKPSYFTGDLSPEEVRWDALKNPAAIEQHKQNVSQLMQNSEMNWNRTLEQLKSNAGLSSTSTSVFATPSQPVMNTPGVSAFGPQGGQLGQQPTSVFAPQGGQQPTSVFAPQGQANSQPTSVFAPQGGQPTSVFAPQGGQAQPTSVFAPQGQPNSQPTSVFAPQGQPNSQPTSVFAPQGGQQSQGAPTSVFAPQGGPPTSVFAPTQTQTQPPTSVFAPQGGQQSQGAPPTSVFAPTQTTQPQSQPPASVFAPTQTQTQPPTSVFAPQGQPQGALPTSVFAPTQTQTQPPHTSTAIPQSVFAPRPHPTITATSVPVSSVFAPQGAQANSQPTSVFAPQGQQPTTQQNVFPISNANLPSQQTSIFAPPTTNTTSILNTSNTTSQSQDPPLPEEDRKELEQLMKPIILPELKPTNQDIEAFQSSQFISRKIPEVPPPPEMCV